MYYEDYTNIYKLLKYQGYNQQVHEKIKECLDEQFEMRYINHLLPYLKFTQLSKSKSGDITICVSGFLSQNDNHSQQWVKFHKNFQGQIWNFGWKSKTYGQLGLNMFVPNILDFLLKPSVLTKCGISSIETFNEAYNDAITSGKILGYLITKIFQGYKINLVAFSLGTVLVQKTLDYLKQKNQINMINHVILMGGAADKSQFQEVQKNQNFKVSNIYCKNDMVLKTLLKICKWSSQPIGLNPLIYAENHDCSKYVDGHLYYRNKMDQIIDKCKLKP